MFLCSLLSHIETQQLAEVRQPRIREAGELLQGVKDPWVARCNCADRILNGLDDRFAHWTVCYNQHRGRVFLTGDCLLYWSLLWPSGPCNAIECLPDEDFDDGLSADVKLSGGVIEFIQHILCEVYIDALNRRHHSTCVTKVARNVLPSLSALCDRVGRDWFPRLKSFLHKVFVPLWLLSRA